MQSVIWRDWRAERKWTPVEEHPYPVALGAVNKRVWIAIASASSKGAGRERAPEIIQKFRLRSWPISRADFPMTVMEGQSTILALF